jgi:hypothetical protein
VVAGAFGPHLPQRSTGNLSQLRLGGDALVPNVSGPRSYQGDLNGSVAGRINGGSQAGLATDDIYRPKFGWYGSPGQNVAVDYRRFVQWVES